MQEILTTLVDQISGSIAEANAIAKRVKAATEGIDEQVAEYIEESSELAEFRQWRDDTLAKIAEVNARLKEESDKAEAHAREAIGQDLDIDVEEEKAKYLSLRSEVTKKRTALGQFFDEDVIAEAMADTEELIGFKGARRGGSGGTPRPRLEAASVNGAELTKPTFSEIAKVLKEVAKVDTTAGDLIKVALETAGVKEWNDANGEQSFEFEGNRVTWTPVAA